MEDTMIGYPLNLTPLPGIDKLCARLNVTLNNLGDPFVGGTYGLNTFEEERQVVGWFADLWHAKSYWGYVTNSGSEGNFRGILEGRQRLGKQAILYASRAAHYSIWKAANWLDLKRVALDVDRYGRVDLDCLDTVYVKNMPAIIVVNAGTTMSGAVDDIPGMMEGTKGSRARYFHVDAALSGVMLPYLEHSPRFDFVCGVDSISVSGHKFPGVPIPCGVYVQRRNGDGIRVEYLGSTDTTVGGSRSGFSVLLLQLALHERNFLFMANACMEKAAALFNLLDGLGIGCWRAPHSITVMIRKPADWVCRKWQLASDDGWAHIICMPHVTIQMLNSFLNDLVYSIQETRPCATLD